MKKGILKTKKLHGFKKETAEELLRGHIEAIKKYWDWCNNKEMKEREITEVKEYESMQETILKQYAEIREAVKKGRLVISWKGGTKYSVGYIKNNEINTIGLVYMRNLSPYRLNFESGFYHVTTYGTSRALELILNYGYKLGLKFKEIPQKQQKI